ncbi:MAG: hypothetical protein E7529_06305 [Ruminococcaceae bacterium]|nr:hypothetical protein [Oscillospiraceae bacterium]
MKRVVAFFVLLLIVGLCFFEFFYKNERKEEEPETTTVNITAEASEATAISENPQNKIYAVWLTYSEIGSFVKGKSEDEYRADIETVFKVLKENEINTVFYQCRAFCDSFYESEIFPASKYITADSRKPDFDPFEIFLEKAKAYNISVHCWINPYRISYNNDFKNLPENSPARELYKGDKNSLIICEEGVFLNPAHTESRRLVLSGIKEILNKYKVNGIHFDDYFYPETKEINDKELYNEYKNQGGALPLAEWRRENVNALISSVYSLVKSQNNALIFSVSPSADIEKCKNVFYADVEKWCREEDFVDLLIPQIYYGFENEKMPFREVLGEWEKLALQGNIKLLCGLAAYKCGKPDEFAGEGVNEWSENVNILSRQYEQVSESPVWQGFSLFSYSYCFGENVTENSKKEIKNLLYMVE